MCLSVFYTSHAMKSLRILGNRLALNYNRYLEKGEISYFLYFSLIRRDLSRSIVIFRSQTCIRPHLVTHTKHGLTQRITDGKYHYKRTQIFMKYEYIKFFKNRKISANCSKNPKYDISQNFCRWQQCCCMRTNETTNRHNKANSRFSKPLCENCLKMWKGPVEISAGHFCCQQHHYLRRLKVFEPHEQSNTD